MVRKAFWFGFERAWVCAWRAWWERLTFPEYCSCQQSLFRCIIVAQVREKTAVQYPSAVTALSAIWYCSRQEHGLSKRSYFTGNLSPGPAKPGFTLGLGKLKRGEVFFFS